MVAWSMDKKHRENLNKINFFLVIVLKFNHMSVQGVQKVPGQV